MTDREFEAFEWRAFGENVSELLSEGWMLITPGLVSHWNTMTASWGGFGHVWNMDVAFIFVRPSRYSYGFLEKEAGFTLSFFDESMKKALDVCGSRSGRTTDKAKAAGITPRTFAADGGEERIGFDEARLVLSCRTVHHQDIDPKGFIAPSIAKNYPAGDYHRLYVGEIEGVWRAIASDDGQRDSQAR
jgi:flavin reductase (DIM6/NTAB) family NADH-FMN oxidoreductase RutF